MKETGIIMSGNHPKLVLDGVKTRTRRVIKLPEGYTLTPTGSDSAWAVVKLGENEKPVDRLDNISCPYGKVGDRLWVRETHRYGDINLSEHFKPQDVWVHYKDGKREFLPIIGKLGTVTTPRKWRP